MESLKGTWREQQNIPGYSGSGFRTSNAKGKASTHTLSGHIDIPRTGQWYVWSRGYEDSRADRSWRVQIGEIKMAPTHGRRRAGSRFAWRFSGTAYLRRGRRRVLVHDAGPGFEAADAIALSMSPKFRPLRTRSCWFVIGGRSHQRRLKKRTRRRLNVLGARSIVRTRGKPPREKRARLRERLLRSFGLEPPLRRGPLRARLLGGFRVGRVRVERITFESLPGLVVPANVYLPAVKKRAPAVVLPLGHSIGKSHETQLALGQALAHQGFVALTYDGIDNGERQRKGFSHREHWNLVLSGRTIAGVMAFETSRAIDYLLTRPDVDPKRIAVTGFSGGGLNSMLAAVFDSRIVAAAPAVYVSEFRSLLTTNEIHDPCTYVPGWAEVADMGETLGLIAPRPLLVLDAKGDLTFPTHGARAAVVQARQVYASMGAGDRVRLLSFAGKHGYSPKMREALYGFLAKHLRGWATDAPVREPKPIRIDPKRLRCYPTAQDPNPRKLASLHEIAKRWAERAAAALPGPESFRTGAARRSLRHKLGVRQRPSPVWAPRGEVEVGGQSVERVAITSERGIVLPGWLVQGDPDGPVVVIVAPLQGNLHVSSLVREAQEANVTALVIRVRGTPVGKDDMHRFVKESLLIGEPPIGQMAADLRQVRLALGSMRCLTGRRVGVVALGAVAPWVALYAQAMWRLFDAVSIGTIPRSLLDLVEPAPRSNPMVVPGILAVADVPHLLSLASSVPLQVRFAATEKPTRYPRWERWVRERIEVVEKLEVGAALSWVLRRLAHGRSGGSG